MGMFPDDEENDELDDKFADDVLRKAAEGYAYIDVDDIADAYNWLVIHERREDAEIVLEYGLNLHAGNCKLLVFRAMTLIDNSSLEKAEMLLDYVADEACGYSEYHISRGWLSLRKGDDKKAEISFDEAVRVAEEAMADTTISEIGSNLVQFEKFSMAAKFFAMLPASFLKSSTQSAFEYAYTLSQLGDDERAIELYEDITTDDPFNESAWYNLGILYAKKGLYVEAKDAYTACTDVDPEYAEAFFNIANIYLEQDELNLAIESYTNYLALSQPEPDMRAYAYLGDCWLRLGDFDIAMRILRFVVEQSPTCDAAWYDLGRCHLELGQYTEAECDFNTAIGVNKEVACYHFALAQAYLNLGLQAKSISSLEEGLLKSPDDVLAWFELIRMSFDFTDCDIAKFNAFLEEKKRKFGSPKALLLVEAYVEFFVFGKKRAATRLLRDVAQCMPQVIKDASEEPDLSKLFEQKGIASVLNEFNIKLK